MRIRDIIKDIFIFGEPVPYPLIPVEKARLCVDCNKIIADPICPICGNKQHILLFQMLEERVELNFKEK